MSVRLDQRNESKLEFENNARRLRKEVTDWLFKDFGQGKKKTIRHVIKNISPEDEQAMIEIFEKYSMYSKNKFVSEYPSWYIQQEREIILKILSDLISDIAHANTIYANSLAEFEMRREYQTKALGDCYTLQAEIISVAECVDLDFNKLSPIIRLLDKEIALLKGWRQSDNKPRKKLEEKEDEMLEYLIEKSNLSLKLYRKE